MGVLGLNGSGDGSQHIDPPELDEAPAPAEGTQPRGDDGQFVPAEKLIPETAASRRERQWQERVSAHVKPLEERWTKDRQTLDEQLAEERRQRQEQAQQLARMQGMLETMQRQPAQQAPQQQGPDPEALFADAEKALAANDLQGYHAKQRAAYSAMATKQAQEAAAKVREEIQRSMPPQIPPHIQNLMYQSPNVAAAGDKGIRAVIRMEQELEDEGMPQGYARTAEAFKRINEKLTKKTAPPAAPSYSRESASALSGVPTGRPGPAGSRAEGDGVRLNEAQMAAMKAGGFKDAAEYLKWNDPHRHGLVKQ